MRIAVIGAGNVGRALGHRWIASGHDVRFGVPDPASGKYADLPGSRVGKPPQAAAGAEAIVLATPWPNTEAAIRGLGDLAGKLVVDCTNPLGMGPNGLSLTVGYSTSGGELVARWAQVLEPFAMLWIDQAMYRGAGQNFAFAVVRRE